MINEKVRHIIEPELDEGEELLWADKPSKFPMSSAAIRAVGFCILWTMVSIFFLLVGSSIIYESRSVIEEGLLTQFTNRFMFMALLFFGVGVVGIVVQIMRLITPSREVYAITNQRGIIISRFLKSRIASLPSNNLAKIERKGALEIGSLIFTSQKKGEMSMVINPHQNEFYTFLKIKNPLEVESLIRKTFLTKD